jgi:hypothetical protein
LKGRLSLDGVVQDQHPKESWIDAVVSATRKICDEHRLGNVVHTEDNNTSSTKHATHNFKDSSGTPVIFIKDFLL